VRCEYSLPDNLMPVEVDEGQINQVLNNLFINADQAMPEGGIITVRAENINVEDDNNPSLSPGEYIELTIEDQGAGIPQEDLINIFDPYFTTKKTGSGLGLATAYSIIKKHDGHINVESEPDVGTTFRIYLPASQKQTPASETHQEKSFPGKGKILVMDDEKTIRDLVGEMLESIGYSVDFAMNGIEAMELYKTAKESGHPFDAVIIDLTVPGSMGGKETIQKLQEIDPQVRAIVSSGYVNDPVVINYHKHGFTDSIGKPYKISELSEKLYKAIART